MPGDRIVLLGMMTKMPVAGVVWQTMHYLRGLQLLGFDAYYVEAHARTPSMLMEAGDMDGSAAAADFIDGVMRRFGFGSDHWAFHALHSDGQIYGMTEERLLELYRNAALIINLHGGTQPREEHSASGRLVYLETDPVSLQVELAQGVSSSVAFLEPHIAFFTFAENLGKPDCGLPVSARFPFLPTRQPVVLSEWQGHDTPRRDVFTTIGNWRQRWREIRYRDDTYSWSKHSEFLRFLDLPSRTDQMFELALSSIEPDEQGLLERHGWRVESALSRSVDLDVYRDYVTSSRGEFTVAKDQNIRLRSGWFSDRSATYLAAGRPVVTQDTGFGVRLPLGAGLFAFTTLDDIVKAVDAIASDLPRHERAAAEIARDHFGHDVVLGDLLRAVGLPGRGSRAVIPGGLVLAPRSRRPLRLEEATDRTVALLAAPHGLGRLPEGAPAMSVIVVTLDNVGLLRLCIAALFANTDGMTWELIVVDNGSADGTAAYLEQLTAVHSMVRSIRNDANLGFAIATNQGILAASGDLLVLLNDDAVVMAGWNAGLAVALADTGVGAVGPVTNRIGNEAQVDVICHTYADAERIADQRALTHRERRFEIPTLAMFCLMTRREVLDRVGLLDERYLVGMLEDDDFSQRLRQAGLTLACVESVYVHHFGEASFGRLVASGEYQRVLLENQRRFAEKWGRSWQPYQRRQDDDYVELIAAVQALIRESVPVGSTVLVVTRGDPEFLDISGVVAHHFPGNDDGGWAGYYPADSTEAIAWLAREEARGCNFLAVPITGMWWLEHYDGLSSHLQASAEIVRDDALVGRLYRLHADQGPRSAAHLTTGS